MINNDIRAELIRNVAVFIISMSAQWLSITAIKTTDNGLLIALWVLVIVVATFGYFYAFFYKGFFFRLVKHIFS